MQYFMSPCSESTLHILLIWWIGEANGTFEEVPVRIMDRRDQVLRGKTMRLVKVWCQHQGVEREDTMCANHPFLFEEGCMFLVI